MLVSSNSRESRLFLVYELGYCWVVFKDYLEEQLIQNIKLVLTALGCAVAVALAELGFILYQATIENSAGSATELPPSSITVYLSGAVKKPGLYSLQANSRIGELLDLGGGITADAAYEWVTANLNLAQKLNDADKIHIPSTFEAFTNQVAVNVSPQESRSNKPNDTSQEGTAEAETSSATTTTKVNINTATQQALEALPGIGEVSASKIILLRPFNDLADLQAKTKFSQATISKIKDLIVF